MASARSRPSGVPPLRGVTYRGEFRIRSGGAILVEHSDHATLIDNRPAPYRVAAAGQAGGSVWQQTRKIRFIRGSSAGTAKMEDRKFDDAAMPAAR